MTGDLLFDPKAGDNYDRDEDHLAMFQELLGKMPKKLALGGKYSKNYFSKKGELKHIMKLNFWPLDEVLVEKYSFTRQEAKEIAGFITPMLAFIDCLPDCLCVLRARDCLRPDVDALPLLLCLPLALLLPEER